MSDEKIPEISVSHPKLFRGAILSEKKTEIPENPGFAHFGNLKAVILSEKNPQKFFFFEISRIRRNLSNMKKMCQNFDFHLGINLVRRFWKISWFWPNLDSKTSIF